MSLLTDWTVLFVQRYPYFVRAAAGLARRTLPSRWVDGLVIGADAVRETFARAEDYSMGHLNEPKLKHGAFLLGMDPPLEQYHYEKQVLVAALEAMPAQIARYAAYDADLTARRLAAKAAQTRGRSRRVRIELGAGYAEPVFARALAYAFGVPARGEACPVFPKQALPLPMEPLARYIRTFGATIGSSHPAPFGLEKLALAAAPYFRAHLEAALRAHRDGSIAQMLPRIAGEPLRDPSQTALGKLLADQPFTDGDEGIVRCIAGMLSASASLPKAFAHVLHELLRRPEHARCFARAIDASDVDVVHAYVREALRFRPAFPLLVRHCPHASTLQATQTPRTAGDLVMFFPGLAMFDPSHVTAPEAFATGRPTKDYFLFGGAPRECIGKDAMMALFLPLFRGLRQHLPQVFEAKPGRLRYDGPALAHYELYVTQQPPDLGT